VHQTSEGQYQNYMTNKATIPTKERETITQLILDTNGLCNANDTFTFEQISSQKWNYEKNVPGLWLAPSHRQCLAP
jgi:hypothetical protein